MKITQNQNGEPMLLLDYGKAAFKFSEITFIKGLGNYSQLFMNTGKSFMSSFTLLKYEQNLSFSQKFFSPKKGLVINLDYLNEIRHEQGELVAYMLDGNKHTLSRRRGKALLKFIEEHIDECSPKLIA
jgi:DNA-binding LytR/AlgR family response regulator